MTAHNASSQVENRSKGRGGGGRSSQALRASGTQDGAAGDEELDEEERVRLAATPLEAAVTEKCRYDVWHFFLSLMEKGQRQHTA